MNTIAEKVRNFWKKKPKGAPTVTPTPQAPDYKAPTDQHRAATVLTRLRDVTVQAENRQLTLKGALPARRAVIVQAVKQDDYVTAEQEVGALGTDVQKAVAEKESWSALETGF